MMCLEKKRRSIQADKHCALRQAWWWKHNAMGMLLFQWHREPRQGARNHEKGGLHRILHENVKESAEKCSARLQLEVPAGQWSESYRQSSEKMVQGQWCQRPRMIKSESWPKSDREPVARLEDQSDGWETDQPDPAWGFCQGRVGPISHRRHVESLWTRTSRIV